MSDGRAEQRVKDTFRHPTAAEVCADVGTKIAIANLRLELERQRQATTSKFPRVCETHGDQDARCQGGPPLCRVRRQGKVREATVSGGRAERRVQDMFRHPTAAEVCADVGTKIARALRVHLRVSICVNDFVAPSCLTKPFRVGVQNHRVLDVVS